MCRLKKTLSFPRRRESDVEICERDRFPFGSAFAEEETPVPIPNTAVKLLVVNGTALVTVWESRTALLLF